MISGRPVDSLQWDVIILGGGPAGAALARRLLPRYRALLLDRPQMGMGATQRIGESLPGAARMLLQRLGMYDRFLAQGHVERGALVSQWDSETPTWFDPIRDPHGTGWHLDRVRFDAGLRNAAIEAGAILVDNVRRLKVSYKAVQWQVEVDCSGVDGGVTSRQTHQAPVLVDATGRSMAAARKLGLARRRRDRLICVYAHFPVDERKDDQAMRICADSNGWWYSVRVPDGQRVLAFHLDSDDVEIKALRDPEQLLTKAHRHRLLAEIQPAAKDFTVHAQPAGGGGVDPGALAGLPEGFFAIGDAMLSFDPIASQGLFNALATAESAGRAIERYFDGAIDARGQFLNEIRAVATKYCQRLDETYGAVRRYSHERFWQRRAPAGPA